MSRGHRKVDQQHRRAPAQRHHLGQLAGLQQQVRRRRGGHDDVGALEHVWQLVEADAAPAVALGQAHRPVSPPGGHEHRPAAAVGQRAGGQLAGLPGADDHHLATLERAQALLGQRDRHRREAELALADRRLGAHALARRQRRLEQMVGQRTDGVLGQRTRRRRA